MLWFGHFHFLLHHVITIYRRYRQTDRRHAHSISALSHRMITDCLFTLVFTCNFNRNDVNELFVLFHLHAPVKYDQHSTGVLNLGRFHHATRWHIINTGTRPIDRWKSHVPRLALPSILPGIGLTPDRFSRVERRWTSENWSLHEQLL